MTATAAEALELALWLNRAPAHRNALLGRPLPEGIGQLLRVATGADDAVAAASRITGEPPQVVLEAVRFYLQQVLFHEDADAYRVLGLRSDASQAQAREHHRLLQHWLHPDRRGKDEWESIYAGRVNSAWTRLRTPQSRRAYDEERSAQGSIRDPAREPEPTITGPIRVARWRGDPEGGPGDRGRSITIGVLGGCVGLLVLIALRPDKPPQWVEGPSSDRIAAEATAEATAGDGASPFAILDAALTREPSQAASAPQVAASLPRASEAAPRVALPAPATQEAPLPTPRTIAVAATRPPVARPDAVPDVTVAAKAIPEPVRRATDAPVVPPEPAAAIAVVVDAGSQPVVPAEVRPRVAKPAPAPARPIPDPLARMTQARDRARLIVAYLDDPKSGQPPVWNDVRTALDAERVRKALHGRLGSSGGVRLQLRSPRWRLSSDGAHLDSDYRASGERGRLGIDFVWREEQLLVSALSVVPAT